MGTVRVMVVVTGGFSTVTTVVVKPCGQPFESTGQTHGAAVVPGETVMVVVAV
jgi:hypothetical protein